jgi:hypothetical protein
MGSVSPRAVDDVRLVSEKLSIVLRDDYEHYDVEADYQLHDDGPARTVEFGVPVIWSSVMGPGDQTADIRLTLQGEAVPCTLAAAQTPAFGWTRSEEVAVYEWCVAKLALPAGPAALQLEYQGQLAYTDWESGKSRHIRYADRELHYLFAPAGYWAGPTGQLQIEVALGPWAERVNSADILEVSGGKARYQAQDVDFRQLQSLRLVLQPETQEERERALLPEPEARATSRSSSLRERSATTPRTCSTEISPPPGARGPRAPARESGSS